MLSTVASSHYSCRGDMKLSSHIGSSPAPLGGTSDLGVVSRLYVYLASRSRNPFRNHDSLIFSEVDLQGVSAGDRLDLILSPRNADEDDIIHSMPFEDAFPGNIVPVMDLHA